MSSYLQTGKFRIPTDIDEVAVSQKLDTEPDLLIPDSIKLDVYQWLNSLKLTKASLERIPHLCYDGTFFWKIINLFKSNQEKIKYYSKKPLTHTEKNINIKKLFIYLRRLPKFPQCNLFNEKCIIDNDFSVIWALLLDLKNYFSPGFYKSENLLALPLLQKSYLSEKSKSFSCHPQFSVISLNSNENLQYITQSQIKKVHEWLEDFGLAEAFDFQNSYFLQDPFRNGLVFGEILYRLGYHLPSEKTFISADSTYAYVTECLNIIKAFPSCNLNFVTPESIMSGNQEAIFGILYNLSLLFPEVPKLKTDFYNDFQRTDLKDSLFNWLKGFKNLANEVRDNEEIFRICKSEKRLCKVIETVFQCQGLLRNFEGCIDFISKNTGMSTLQKFNLTQDDCVLLIFENFHRVYDGINTLPFRNFSNPVYTGLGYRKG